MTSGIDWFEVRMVDGYMEVVGQGNLYSNANNRLKIIGEAGNLIVVKRPGQRGSSRLPSAAYSPARFEVWEFAGGRARKRLSFPVRS